MLLIKNGNVFQDGVFKQNSILVDSGKIAKIAPNIPETRVEQIIDAQGLFVVPGMIDVHVHFREPGGEHKEDWTTGSRAAAAGGVTTVFDMPNNAPPVTDQQGVAGKRERAKKSLVNYGMYVGATKENVLKINEVRDVVGVKVYMGSSTGNLLLDNIADFVKLVENTTKHIVVHAENEEMIKYFSEKFRATKMHHKMRDNFCAAVAAASTGIAANYFKKHVHIAHMSTKEEVEFLKKYKTEYITCEVCPHHLFFDQEFFCEHGNFGKMNPPLRYAEDTKSLWDAVNAGLIDMIATDHAPHTKDEKHQEFEKAPCGVPGVQTAYPLMLDAALNKKTTIATAVRLCAENPARVFGLTTKGKIKEGFDADLAIVNLNKEVTIKNEDQQSKCGWTPFDGRKIKASVVTTIVNGNVVFDKGTFNDAVKGNLVVGQ